METISDRHLEMASENNENNIYNRVAEITRSLSIAPPPHFDGLHCISCDDEIPEKRRSLGKFRCVDCQSILESKRR